MLDEERAFMIKLRGQIEILSEGKFTFWKYQAIEALGGPHGLSSFTDLIILFIKWAMFLAGLTLFTICEYYSVKKYRNAKKNLLEKFRARSACDIDLFIKTGDLTPMDDAERDYIQKARKIIAFLGEVPEDSIYPTDTFSGDLGDLPFWDNLDLAEYLIHLEKETGVDFPREIIIQGLNGPDYKSKTYTVGVFMKELVEMRKKRLLDENSDSFSKTGS